MNFEIELVVIHVTRNVPRACDFNTLLPFADQNHSKTKGLHSCFAQRFCPSVVKDTIVHVRNPIPGSTVNQPLALHIEKQ